MSETTSSSAESPTPPRRWWEVSVWLLVGLAVGFVGGGLIGGLVGGFVGNAFLKSAEAGDGFIEGVKNGFQCGHIISEYNGGVTEVTNMRPICPGCNQSMGKTNWGDWDK